MVKEDEVKVSSTSILSFLILNLWSTAMLTVAATSKWCLERLACDLQVLGPYQTANLATMTYIIDKDPEWWKKYI